MKTRLAILFLSLPLICNAQQLDFSGAYSIGNFFNGILDGPGEDDYRPGNGFMISAGYLLPLFHTDYQFIRFGLSFAQYGSKVHGNSGALGAYQGYTADFRLNVLSFDVYPLSFKIARIVHLEAGLSYANILSNSVDGTWSKSGNGPDGYYSKSGPVTGEQFGAKHSFAFYNNRVAILIPVGKFEISPYYQFSLGLFTEVSGYSTASSYRHIMGLSFRVPA